MKQSSLRTIALASLVALPSVLAAQRDTLRSGALTGIEPKKTFSTVNRFEAQDPASAFAQYLFPPELVMQHQARLKITEAQRNVIVAEISKLQATAVQVQWRVGDESEKLTELLQGETVAEADVLAQADRMIMYETAVKRAQLSMLIRIRNVLTPEQRTMLRELRRRD
jgi:Spy/CpxP family protein refolding chaperone